MSVQLFNTANFAYKRVGNAASAAGEAVHSGANTVRNTVGEAATTVRDGVRNGYDKAGTWVNDGTRAVGG